MPATKQDINFAEAMHDLLDMDEKAVEELLDKLSADELQALMDAVAKQDRDAAQQVIGQFNTDEEVNALFRGKNLDRNEKKRRRTRNRDGKMQFAIGDNVSVRLEDEKTGKHHRVTATVSRPEGPEDTGTVVVSIEGKTKVVDKKNVDKLDETIIGMLGLPNLQRIQQLAGIQGQGEMMQTEPMPMEPEPLPIEPAPDDPLGQAMAALETLEAAIPNITLADAKCVRERLFAVQRLMNESASTRGRTRKL